MFKLLVTLGTFLLVALSVFGLRQQRLEITADCVRIYHDIENHKDTLRSQHVEIARETNSRALAMGMQAAGMETGDALQYREGRTGRRRTSARSTPQVETDLIESLRDHDSHTGHTSGSGHGNPSRPR